MSNKDFESTEENILFDPQENDLDIANQGLIAKKRENDDEAARGYSILKFLTRDTGILIAAVSGIIAFFSCVLKFFSILITNQYLSYWNVSSDLISSKDSIVPYLGLAAACLILLFLANSLISESFDCYKNVVKYSMIAKKLASKKEMRRDERNLRALSKKIKKIEDTSEKRELQDKYEEEEKRISTIRESINLTRKGFKILKREEIQILRFDLILSFVVFLIANFFLQAHALQESFLSGLIIVFAASVLSFLIALFISSCAMIRTIKRQIKKVDLIKEITHMRKEISQAMPPILKIKKEGIKPWFRNESFITAFAYFLIISVATIMIVPLVTGLELSQKTEFITVIEEDISYVSVYSDDQIMILEKAEIDDNDLTILTYKQRILPVENVEYEVREFEKVTRQGYEMMEVSCNTIEEIEHPEYGDSLEGEDRTREIQK